jgi:hypothetical protein
LDALSSLPQQACDGTNSHHVETTISHDSSIIFEPPTLSSLLSSTTNESHGDITNDEDDACLLPSTSDCPFTPNHPSSGELDCISEEDNVVNAAVSSNCQLPVRLDCNATPLLSKAILFGDISIPQNLLDNKQMDIIKIHPPMLSPPLLAPPNNIPFISVPFGTWFKVSIMPIAPTAVVGAWLAAFAPLGVFAMKFARVHIKNNVGELALYRTVHLLFKSHFAATNLIAQLHASLLLFRSFEPIQGVGGRSLPDYKKMYWLPYIGEIFQNAVDGLEFDLLMQRAPLHPKPGRCGRA